MEQFLVDTLTFCSGKHRFSLGMRKLEWNLSWGMVLGGDEFGCYKNL